MISRTKISSLIVNVIISQFWFESFSPPPLQCKDKALWKERGMNNFIIVIIQMCTLLCFQAAAKMIKESMDKKFGSSWHAVVGEGYGFELTHEVKNLLYMFFGGTVAVCIWKCSWKENDIHWWTILVYIYNISDIIIPWKMYWLVLEIVNINHHHHSGQNIFQYFCLVHGVWCYKLAVHCVKECQSWSWWLNLKS